MAGGSDGVGDPALAGWKFFLRGCKECANVFAGEDLVKDVFGSSVGDDGGFTCRGDDFGGFEFGCHATGSQCGFGSGDVFGDFGDVFDKRDDLLLVIVEAVDDGEEDKGVCAECVGDHRGQDIVIAE